MAKKILVVEDETPQCEAIRDKFTHEGYEVVVGKNGKVGLELALSEHPDLILLDIIMPEMDGLTMLKKLREDEWGKDAEVIMLSNLNDNSKVAAAMEQGTHEYLLKTDWKLEDVVAKVKEKIG